MIGGNPNEITRDGTATSEFSNHPTMEQNHCKKCEYVKEKIPPGLEVSIFDLSGFEAVAEAAFLELIGRHTPILVVDEAEIVEGAVNIKNRLLELGGVS